MRGEFEELARRLHARESVVIEHEYESAEAFRPQRSAFHEEPGEVGQVLADLAALSPGAAVEFELDGLET